MASPVAVLDILVRANTGAASAQLTTLDRQLKGTAATANSTSAALGARLAKAAKYGALGLAGIGAVSVKMAVDFDKSMRNVNSIAQLNEKQFRKLGDEVKALAGKTAQAPQTLAEGLYDLVSSGFDAAESMKVLKASANAATAGLTDTATSTKAVAAVLNAYRMPASKAGKVSDVLFRTVDRGVISFEELAGTIGNVLPAATTLGVKLPEVGAAISTLTKEGQSGATAVTNINAAMTALFKPSEAMKKALADVGYESAQSLVKARGFEGALKLLIGATDGSAEALGELFTNVRAQRAVFGLTGRNAADAAADLRGLKDSAGATQRALDEQTKSVAFMWQQLKAKASTLAIDIGDTIIPAIKDMLTILNNPKLTLEEKISKLADRVVRAIEEWGPKVAKAGGMIGLKIIKGIADAFWHSDLLGKLFIGAAALKLFGGAEALKALGRLAGKRIGGGMTGGIIVGLAIGWALLAPEAFKLGKKLGAQMKKPLRGFFKWMVDTFGGVADKVLGLFSSLIGSVADVYDKLAGVPVIGEAFKPIADGLHGVEDSINGVRDAMRDIREFRKNPLGFTREALRQNAGDVGAVTDKLVAMGISYKRAIKLATKAGDEVNPSLRRNQQALDLLGSRLGTTGGKWDGYGRDLGRSLDRGNKNTDKHRDKVEAGMDRIREQLGQSADKAGDYEHDLSKSFGKTTGSSARMAKGVGRNVGSLADGVATGLDNIKDNLNKSLAAFHVKKVAYSIAKVGNTVKNTVGGFQRGGTVVPGQGSGDKIPLHVDGRLAAMVEPGEYVSVANRTATAALMAHNKRVPRRQGGGIVPRLAGGGMVTGDTDYLPELGRALEAMAAATHRSIFVQSGGRTMAEQAALYQAYLNGTGNLAAPPNQNAPHIRGIAADITPGQSVFGGVAGRYGLGFPVPGESWHIQLMDPSAAKGSAGAAPHLARALLKGPDGPLKNMGQAVLDKALKGARQLLARQMPTGGGYTAVKSGGSVVRQMGQILLGNNFTRQGAAGIIGNAYRESLWDPGAVGTGGGGLFGFTTSPVSLADLQSFAKRKGRPWTDVATQMEFMLANPGGGGLMTEGYYNDLESFLKSTSSVHDATFRFMDEWERPGIPAFEDRLAGAQKSLGMFRQGGIVSYLAGGGEPGKDGKKPGKGSVKPGPTDRAYKRFMHARRIAAKLKDLIGERGTIAKIDERISIAETMAGLDSSELGSETGPKERQKQIRLNQLLLSKLVMARKLSRSGLSWLEFPKGMSTAALKPGQLKNLRGVFGSTLVDMTGVTGSGGRIFDTKMALDALKHTTSTGPEPLDISGLRSVIEAARYGAFDGMFATGGQIKRGRWGVVGERGPEIIRGPATVDPVGQLAPKVEVNNNFDWEGMDLYVTTTVNGEIAKRERVNHRRGRQAVR